MTIRVLPEQLIHQIAAGEVSISIVARVVLWSSASVVVQDRPVQAQLLQSEVLGFAELNPPEIP